MVVAAMFTVNVSDIIKYYRNSRYCNADNPLLHLTYERLMQLGHGCSSVLKGYLPNRPLLHYSKS